MTDVRPIEKPPRGRPRGFEATAAVEAATRLFWAEGYEATSVDDLCKTMQMPRATLYSAFGGKERLFLAAIDHYATTRLAPLAAALGPKGTLVQDLTAFFDQVVVLATQDAANPGCLISCVLSDAAGANPLFRAELDRRYAGMEHKIAARLRLTGEALPAPPEVLAVLLASVARGLTLRARSGATAANLRPVAAAAARVYVQPAGV
jgi:TetR/AcrR family transcriptional repressor of nem operon